MKNCLKQKLSISKMISLSKSISFIVLCCLAVVGSAYCVTPSNSYTTGSTNLRSTNSIGSTTVSNSNTVSNTISGNSVGNSVGSVGNSVSNSQGIHSHSNSINGDSNSHAISHSTTSTRLYSTSVANSYDNYPMISRKTTKLMPKIRSIYDRLSYGWVKELMQLGNKKALDIQDLWLLEEEKQMKYSSEKYDEFLTNELKNQHKYEQTGEKKSKNVLMEFWRSPVSRAAAKMYKTPLIVAGILKLFNTLVQFLPSILIAKILKTVTTSSQSGKSFLTLKDALMSEGSMLSLLLFFVLCVKTAIENQYFDVVVNTGADIRSTLSAAIYRKSLKLGPGSRKTNTLGEIVNYMQLDTARMEQVVGNIHVVWDGLLQVFGYTSLLLYFLGPSVIAGILGLVGVIVLNSVFILKLSSLRAAILGHTDNRVKTTNEILQGIRAIKSYNWEKAFLSKLIAIRNDELRAIMTSATTRAVLIAALSAAPSIVAVFTLGVYALLGNTLDATKVFTSLALFNQLRFPLIFFPITLNALAEGKVSLDRLTTFLLTDEIQNYVEDGDSSNSDSTKDCISISNGSFSYSDDKSNSTLAARGSLNDIDVHIKKGELVAVVGSTGSGKSTLLYSMLGELAKEKGSVMVNGSVAYVPQSSWIPNDSLRNVILFGNKMEWDKYRSVIKDCGLERDLQLLDSGDQTEIGERGVNLSGGQKQRVSIARAVYSDAEIFFFDDPLSALDAEVGAKLFKDCIVDRLHNKTRILVTHQLNVLPKVDRIIIMNTTESGSSYILAQGTLTELQSKGYDLKQLVSKDEESEEGENEKGQADHEERDTPVKKSLESKDKLSSENGQLPRALPVSEDESVAKVSTHPDYILTDPFLRKAVNVSGLNSNILVDIMPPLMGTLVECRTQECDENDQECQLESLLLDETGRKIPVATRIADEVIQSLGAGSGDSIIPGGVGTEDASTKQESSGTEETEKEVRKLMTVEDRAEGAVGWDVYKSYIKAANRPLLLFAAISSFVLSNVFQILQQWIVAAWTSDAGYVKRSLPVYLGSVAAMAGFVAGFTWLRTFLAVAFGASASRTIHSSMARRVLSAPLQYFESTPVGRLVQRFSKDLDQIDQQLPNSFSQVLSSTLSIIGSAFAICVVTPSFSLVMIVISIFYVSITSYFRNVARELKRVDALTRSPIFAHFGETLNGLPVIRSYQRQEMYRKGNEVKLDDNLSAYYSMKAVDRWLSVRLEFLGNIIVLFSSVLAVITGSKAGSAGLSLNNAIGVTGLLNWAVRNGLETESLMTSVERVLYTSEQTPQEAPTEQNEIPADAFYANSKYYYPNTTAVAESMVNISSVSSPENEIRIAEEILKAQDHSQDAQVISLSHNAASAFYPTNDQQLLQSGWPWKGSIIMKNLMMRYREDFEYVLRGVDVEIEAGERVGIVGRTGSGKSSLFRALLRLTELESGSIMIDGVDIGKVGLDALRSSISIIPQDPVLFSGSIRLNLDPFGTHTDGELWTALRKSNLAMTVASLPNQLQYEVQEGGENFSSGQRQLLCLARALVRRSKILLLDEATSSVDYDTDALVQKTIREEFGKQSGCTVLTIAHRLETIMDSDKILAMDAGLVREYDSPSKLLTNRSSLFSQLVRAEQRQKMKRITGGKTRNSAELSYNNSTSSDSNRNVYTRK